MHKALSSLAESPGVSGFHRTNIFRLIHCMSKHEKKHFKLYACYYSKNARSMNYLRLFDVIEKQKEYNEEKIMSRLIGIKKERLPALRHYLHNLILESLRVLSGKGENIDNKLNNLLHDARIMREKGLEEKGIRFLEKAKELALKHERWGIAMEAIVREMGIANISGDVKARQRIEREMEMLLINSRNLLEHMKLNRKIYVHIKRSEMQRNVEDKTLKKLISHPLLSASGGEKALSAQAKKTYYNTLFMYHYFMGDYQGAYKIISQSLRFVESHYSTIILPEENYSVVLNNLTSIQHYLGKYQEALSTIQKHRSLVQKSGTVNAHAFVSSYINETNYYLSLGEFEKGTDIIKDIEKELDKVGFKLKVSDTALFTLYCNIAILYFGYCEYHKSLIWVNKIIYHPKVMFREDAQAWARILQILIHYELKTPDILKHLRVSTVRFLHKKNMLYKVEDGLMRFIGRVSKIDLPAGKADASQKAVLEELHRFRDELVKITKNPEEKKALLYFDLVSWVESKIKNRPFAEIVLLRSHAKDEG